MAPERPKGVDGKLIQAPEIIPGTLRDREQRAQPLGPRRSLFSRLTHSKAGLAAGAAALVGVLVFGLKGGDNQPNQDTSPTPRPTTSEAFNPRESALKILDAKNDNPELKTKTIAHIGSSISVSFTETNRGGTYPRLRTSTELVDVEGARTYNAVSNQDIQAINGLPVDLKPGSEIKISNYISVPGYDADGGLTRSEGEWLAFEATLNDGSNKILYMSISQKTRPNWDTDSSEYAYSTQLSQAIDQNKELNKTEVIN